MNNAISFHKTGKHNKFAHIEPLVVNWGVVKRELRGISEVNKIVATEQDSYLLRKENFLKFEHFKIIDSYANSAAISTQEFLIYRYVFAFTFDIIASELKYSKRQVFYIKDRALKEISQILGLDSQ